LVSFFPQRLTHCMHVWWGHIRMWPAITSSAHVGCGD
jgi:hypothetical protein